MLDLILKSKRLDLSQYSFISMHLNTQLSVWTRRVASPFFLSRLPLCLAFLSTSPTSLPGPSTLDPLAVPPIHLPMESYTINVSNHVSSHIYIIRPKTVQRKQNSRSPIRKPITVQIQPIRTSTHLPGITRTSHITQRAPVRSNRSSVLKGIITI